MSRNWLVSSFNKERDKRKASKYQKRISQKAKSLLIEDGAKKRPIIRGKELLTKKQAFFRENGAREGQERSQNCKSRIQNDLYG